MKALLLFQSLYAHATSPISWKFDSWATRLVLALVRNQVQMARFAKHLPIQRIAAMLIWFRRELDDTDLQKT